MINNKASLSLKTQCLQEENYSVAAFGVLPKVGHVATSASNPLTWDNFSYEMKDVFELWGSMPQITPHTTGCLMLATVNCETGLALSALQVSPLPEQSDLQLIIYYSLDSFDNGKCLLSLLKGIFQGGKNILKNSTKSYALF